jgi:hypothetical protein
MAVVYQVTSLTILEELLVGNVGTAHVYARDLCYGPGISKCRVCGGDICPWKFYSKPIKIFIWK